MQLPELPTGWEWKRLGAPSVARVIMGQSPPSKTYNVQRKGLPFFQGKVDFGALHPIPRLWCSDPLKTAEAGDVLISVRAPVGPTNLCTEKSCIGRGLAAIRAQDGNHPRYLLYCLRAMEKDIVAAGQGSTFNAIDKRQLEDLRMPLPPTEEQRRIVGRIEELLDRIDRARLLGRATLQQSDALLKSALGSIFDKETKARWKIRPLLDICEKAREPIQTGPFGAQLKSSEFVQSGIPVLAIGNVRSSGLEPRKLNYVAPEKANELGRYKVQEGDVVFARMGTIGRCCVIPRYADNWLISYHLIRIAVDKAACLPEYLQYCLTGCTETLDYIDRASRGATRSGLNTAILSKAPIPLAPLEEQRELVSFVGRLRFQAETIGALQKGVRAEFNALSQAILAKAFRGEL